MYRPTNLVLPIVCNLTFFSSTSYIHFHMAPPAELIFAP